MATINMHMKFEIEIPKQTWLMLRKPCRLQTDGRTDRRTDGQGESSIPPSNFVERGYNNMVAYGLVMHQGLVCPKYCDSLIQCKDVVLPVYGKAHYRDETVSHLPYLYNGNPYTWKDGLYLESALQLVETKLSFKNAYELWNLRALGFSPVNCRHIFQCMGKIFCVEFKRVPLKFHTKYLTHTLIDTTLIHVQHWNINSS